MAVRIISERNKSITKCKFLISSIGMNIIRHIPITPATINGSLIMLKVQIKNEGKKVNEKIAIFEKDFIEIESQNFRNAQSEEVTIIME